MNKSIWTLSIVLPLYSMLICIASSVYAKQTAREQIQLRAAAALQRVKSDSQTPVRTRWHRDRGTVRSLYNLTLPLPPGTPETSARQCLSRPLRPIWADRSEHRAAVKGYPKQFNRQTYPIPPILQGGLKSTARQSRCISTIRVGYG